jgi:hypothetical protein
LSDNSWTTTWCERRNININEDETRGIYFSRSRRPPESHLTLSGRDIPFVNSVKYLGVIFDKKVTWRLHIEMIEQHINYRASINYFLIV